MEREPKGSRKIIRRGPAVSKPHRSAGEPVKPAIVGLHDGANGHLIACAGALHQFGVRAPDGSDLRYLGVAHDDFALSNNMLLLIGWMRQRQIGPRHQLAD